MATFARYALFAQGIPGLEDILVQDLRRLGFDAAQPVAGGADFAGSLEDVLRANRQLRCAGRVLLRLGTFRAAHLSEIARSVVKMSWASFIDPTLPVRLRCTCRASRVYHSGAAAQRVQEGIEAKLACQLTLAPPQHDDDAAQNLAWSDAAQQIFIRIERNMCTVSIDASGVPLHRRGTKPNTAKAPLRETLAAAFLDACGWQPHLPLIDPMCGSGTFLIEAASLAAGLDAGRSRTFACQRWPAFRAHKAAYATKVSKPPKAPQIWGFDRDAGAVAAATANVARAGLAKFVHIAKQSLGSFVRTQTTQPGYVICNPPYGHRIGDAHALRDLYAALGHIMRSQLPDWRLALVTSDARLAKATKLKLEVETAPVPHGGLKIRLYTSMPENCA